MNMQVWVCVCAHIAGQKISSCQMLHWSANNTHTANQNSYSLTLAALKLHYCKELSMEGRVYLETLHQFLFCTFKCWGHIQDW